MEQTFGKHSSRRHGRFGGRSERSLGHDQGGVCEKVGNTASKRESGSNELTKAVVADRLAGQHEAYMVGQLRLRKAGLGPSTDASAPMTPIPQRLNDDDIRAVSAYFAMLPPAR